jgi:hypothetical protein
VDEALFEIAAVLESLLFELVAAIAVGFLFVLGLVIDPLANVVIFVLECIGFFLNFICGSEIFCTLDPNKRVFEGLRELLVVVGWELFVGGWEVVGTLRGGSEELLGAG